MKVASYVALALLVLSVASPPARAATATVPAGETRIIDLTENVGDADDSGVILRNLAARACTVTIGGTRARGGTVRSGYAILDRSMTVRARNLRARQYRVCVRREYTRQALREKGIRFGTQRLMRRCNGVWQPARACVRKPNVRKVRYANFAGPTREEVARAREKGRVGDYGYCGDDTYVWGVIDVDGEYGVGGLVPEPVTATFLLAGLGGLAVARRRRK